MDKQQFSTISTFANKKSMKTQFLQGVLIMTIVLLLTIPICSQNVSPCGHDHVLSQWWKQNPILKTQYEQTISLRQKTKSIEFGSRNNKIVIPVVFHILHQNGAENISNAQIYDQIRILNRDYQKMNADTVQVVSAFKNKIADVNFEFQLARIDPYGNCTDGIVRHFTPKTNWNSSRLEDFTYTWPADKYMNIYIVKKIDIAPAYTFLPGIGIPDYADVIVSESWLVGSIGTATAANSRVLTHEIGHWFGLPHIWGISNAPGVVCGDDGVDDTPITKGFVVCTPNNAKICDPNIVENVQNYMDYTPCKLMFTFGQAAYMKETITLGLNKRDHLVSEENLIATGIIGEKPCTTVANFYSIYSNICKGESVRFFDQSQTGSKNRMLTWFIEGGIPSFSTDSVIDVTFPNTGEYAVKLIVSGPNGVDSISKFIQVLDGNNGLKTPVKYTFLDGILPTEIQVYNNQVSNLNWETISSYGAENTDGCIFINNAGSGVGNGSYFETPFYDFSDNSKPNMSYYYSYAKYEDTQMDSFRLEFTTDCGKTWKVFPNIPNLNTMSNNTGGVTSNAFFPDSPQKWKKVNLTTTFQTLFKNKPSVKFRFYFRSDPVSKGSNNIFLDEINITNESVSTLPEQNESDIQIYPNPSNDEINVSINTQNTEKHSIEISNVTGQIFDQFYHFYYDNTNKRYIVNQEGQMSPGIYLLKIKMEGYLDLVKKIVIIK